MQSSLYVALSAQVAMERRLNTIANNVANMNTGGFRADEVKFEEISLLPRRRTSPSPPRDRTSYPGAPAR